MTEGPTPRGAADVLREHWWNWRDERCACVPRSTPLSAIAPTYEEHAQHQADMLAAAGLLATTEHDGEVLRNAADAMRMEFDVERSRSIGFGDPHDLSTDIAAALEARADRIAGGAA